MEEKTKSQSVIKEPKIIVITGAESTGKSTLTAHLATHFNVPFVTEIAREYVENLGRQYNYYDIEKIAKFQVDTINEFKKTGIQYIFSDTWLIITKVWFEFVYKKIPGWIEDEIRNAKIDLFLLCDIDLPWVADPVRENGGENRIILHNIYIENLEKYAFNYKIVKGQNKERFNLALKYISELNQNFV